MSLMKLIGCFLMIGGLCGMLLGSALVPVNAPVWADFVPGHDGGSGGSDHNCSHQNCNKCGDASLKPGHNPELPGSYDCVGLDGNPAKCETSNVGDDPCLDCEGGCEINLDIIPEMVLATCECKVKPIEGVN